MKAYQHRSGGGISMKKIIGEESIEKARQRKLMAINALA